MAALLRENLILEPAFSTLSHPGMDENRTRLDWETRLNLWAQDKSPQNESVPNKLSACGMRA